MYVEEDTSKVIRYSSRSNRWLLDTNGLSGPSVVSRVSSWLFKGDTSAADRCNAFAEAGGTSHPACASLKWYVSDTRTGKSACDHCPVDSAGARPRRQPRKCRHCWGLFDRGRLRWATSLSQGRYHIRDTVCCLHATVGV